MPSDEKAYMMTVIMPSYNNGKYIEQAIQSVLEQEVDFSLRLLISDDASKDDSVSIIKKYEEQYPDIIYGLYAVENKGLFDNYYKAVEKMNTKYFCVLDPDDYYTDKKRLQKAVDFLENHVEYTIYASNAFAVKDDTGERVKKYYPYMPIGETHTSTLEDFFTNSSFLCNTPGTTFRNVVYCRDMIAYIKETCKNGLYDKTAFRADTGRNVVHLTKGKAFFVNEYVAEYRIHDHNMMQNLKDYEKFLCSAKCYIVYDAFFKGKYIQQIYILVRDLYRQALISYSAGLDNSENLLNKEDSVKILMDEVSQWLYQYRIYGKGERQIYYHIDSLADLENRKLIIWGTGSAASRLLKEYRIDLKEGDFFVNGNLKSGQTSNFCNTTVYSPMDVMFDESYVIIACRFYREIIREIEENSLYNPQKVINLYAFDQFFGALIK